MDDSQNDADTVRPGSNEISSYDDTDNSTKTENRVKFNEFLKKGNILGCLKPTFNTQIFTILSSTDLKISTNK